MKNNQILEGYNNYFKNRLYGLLCEYEKGQEWEKFLDSLLIELLGYPEEKKTIHYYVLFYNLSSLKYLKYEFFRKKIFDCMNLMEKI